MRDYLPIEVWTLFVIACPFGAMEVVTDPAHRMFAGIEIPNGVKAEAHKCDLCIDRAAGPACVQV